MSGGAKFTAYDFGTFLGPVLTQWVDPTCWLNYCDRGCFLEALKETDQRT